MIFPDLWFIQPMLGTPIFRRKPQSRIRGSQSFQRCVSFELAIAINLRQTYERLGKRAFIMQGRYSHARQMNQSKREQKRLKVFLGRVVRDIRRKCLAPEGLLATMLERSEQLLRQQRNDKNKLYSLQAPEVECIAKGKAHKKYEFGCKVSLVSTSKDNWIIGVQAVHGNP